jgi:hypothetical protein
VFLFWIVLSDRSFDYLAVIGRAWVFGHLTVNPIVDRIRSGRSWLFIVLSDRGFNYLVVTARVYVIDHIDVDPTLDRTRNERFW